MTAWFRTFAFVGCVLFSTCAEDSRTAPAGSDMPFVGAHVPEPSAGGAEASSPSRLTARDSGTAEESNTSSTAAVAGAEVPLDGIVADFVFERPMRSVTQQCLAGEPADGKRTQETKDDGVFRWSFKKPERVEIRFSFTGWAVINPDPVKASDGSIRADVVSWDVPTSQSQPVEMWRTVMSLEMPKDVETYAIRLGERLASRASAERVEGRVQLGAAWRQIEASPFPVFGRIHVAKRIAELVSKSDDEAQARCLEYARTDPDIALKWDLAVRAADEGRSTLPSLKAGDGQRLPKRIAADAIDAAIRVRQSTGKSGSLGRVALMEWSEREGVQLERTLRLLERRDNDR